MEKAPSGASRKVIFCIPTITKPYQQTLDALAASVPLIREAGWEEGNVYEIGCPYISVARATMLRKALDAKADVIVFIDHDLSWKPQDLLTLIETPGDVVAGTYRFKHDDEDYMGSILADKDGYPIPGPVPGSCLAMCVPAGFLKITKEAVSKFMRAYPELVYGPDEFALNVDLFNHGAHNRVWYGEDYSFSRRWTEKCGEIVLLPNLDLTHHTKEAAYPGNFHKFLCKQPGGSDSENPRQ